MRFKLEHRIGVKASPSEVWALISDLEGWKAWNPIHPEVSGELRFGARLIVTEALPGQAPDVITPEVIDWVPDSHIHWRDKTAGGLVRRLRYLEIQTLSETGCIFSNGEIYDGLGTRFISRPMRQALQRGFTELGEAVKTTVEARLSVLQGDAA
jgi:hypothetical protein